jgi:hypothetical protein
MHLRPPFACALLLTALAAVVAAPAAAQVSYGGVPPSSYAALKSSVPVLELPPVDVAALLAEDATRAKGPLRYGALVPIGATLDELGAREVLPSGEQVWRAEIRSSGARSLAVVFDHYELPLGGQLFVYDPARTQVLGAYTDLNNQANLEFGFEPVLGDRLVLEYVEPADAPFHATLQVREAIHDYRGLPELLAKSADSGADAAGACNVDVNCPQGASWQDKKRAITRIVAGGALCTGALLNNVNGGGTQYYMTAYHCGSMNSAVFLFNYEKSGCSSGSAPTNQTVSGSTLLAGNSGYDYRLVQLTQAIPASYKPFFLGWNRTTSAPSSTTTIHHPQGDVKKISVDNNAPQISGNQWRVVQWDLGVTEPGSSGCPLIRNDGRFIGQLCCGAAYCGFPYDDYYGRFDLAWPSVKAWLDPNNTNPTGIDGWDSQGAATPPSISGLAPTSVQAFAPGSVTITGTGFTGATQVKVGSTTLLPPFGFTIVSNTQITCTPPAPSALGAQAVTVSSGAGTSNALNLTYVETNPPLLAVSPFALTNTTHAWEYGGGASDFAFLLASGSSTLVPILGANIFASYTVLKSQVLSPVGLGSYSILVPPSALGVTIYTQVATYDGVLRASTVAVTSVLF